MKINKKGTHQKRILGIDGDRIHNKMPKGAKRKLLRSKVKRVSDLRMMRCTFVDSRPSPNGASCCTAVSVVGRYCGRGAT